MNYIIPFSGIINILSLLLPFLPQFAQQNTHFRGVFLNKMSMKCAFLDVRCFFLGGGGGWPDWGSITVKAVMWAI